jgi:hydrogenase maturation protein HypF
MSGSRIRAEVRVTGVVQGVGFRPFVYRTAVGHGLAGSVKNTGDAGVEIVLEGPADDVEAFLHDLETDAPPLSVVESVQVDRTTPTDLETFEIVQSTDSSGGSGTIPPDTGMCDNCLDDVRDRDSRYHDYWATSCVDCGPRFTVIRELPYDRPTTSMDAFPMCPDCRAEYTDPADRRYHAQTIACPECGPELSLFDGDASPVVDGTESIRATASRLRNGDVVAIKGIGGTHVACDATDPGAVSDLRDRTGRPAKPFALMVSSLEQVERFARVSAAERSALTDTRRPIVLLEIDDSADRDWLEDVSPGLHTVGVMLPYSGLHHLLFDHVDRPLVMTSGNLPGQPMALTREAIFDQLGDVVDAALVHDREIVARCDDSVVRFVDGERHFVRRSRGWVPVGLPRPVPGEATTPDVLAVGAEFDAAAALTQGDDVIPTQHVGDVDDPETVAYHRAAVSHLQALTGADPELVACDRHPDFLTTREAERYADAGMSGPVRVQHHHAHAASLLGEHDGVDRAIVVTADGTGYGEDGTVWGGEVLDATLESSDRVGGLGRFALPGGEAAVRRPARILASLLADDERVTSLLVDTGTVDSVADARTVCQQARQGVNSPVTTSAGRFLDAVSALLGAGPRRQYEGEPAMKLEALAADGSPLELAIPYAAREATRVVDVQELASRLDELARDHPAADVAATAQVALGTGLADIAVEAARERGVDAVGFSGGVAYNDAISRTVREVIEGAGLTFLPHRDVPPGDAGIAYGQALVATARSPD